MKKPLTVKELSSLGGKARMASMSKSERKRFAAKGLAARRERAKRKDGGK